MKIKLSRALIDSYKWKRSPEKLERCSFQYLSNFELRSEFRFFLDFPCWKVGDFAD